MKTPNGTLKRRVRIAAELEPAIIALIDRERKGRCSRATIVRIALLDRYQKTKRTMNVAAVNS
jgi:hypothetical protein